MILADIIAKRLDALHPMVGLNRMYLIDTVSPAALYWLAKQFDVLGYKGWFQADTEEKRRALIKRAIELHRYKGTPWAVKEAIKTLGFTQVVLQERVGLNDGYYNGLFDYDGTHTYGGDGVGEWATFRVVLNLDEYNSFLGQGSLTALIALINEYKNVRSHLVGIVFQVGFEDTVEFEDATDNTEALLIDNDYITGFTLNYDGMADYDGEYEYDFTGDTLTITESSGPQAFVVRTAGVDETMRMVFSDIVDVDWGDGTVETNLIGAVSHTYATIDSYDIFITGSLITGIEIGSASTGYEQPFSINGIPSTVTSLVINGQVDSAVDLTGIAALELLTIVPTGTGDSGVQSVVLPENISALNYVSIKDNPMSQGVVDGLWEALDAGGVMNGYAFIRSDPYEAPSGSGLAAITSLQAKGWSCVYE